MTSENLFTKNLFIKMFIHGFVLSNIYNKRVSESQKVHKVWAWKLSTVKNERCWVYHCNGQRSNIFNSKTETFENKVKTN